MEIQNVGSIDVVMLTKNSEHVLDQCLRSIYENVPVNRLIIVDGSSKDKTLRIIDEYSEKYGNVKVITENGSRATARERGIQEVETKWFAFVDSDVVLCKDWFRKASKHMREGVGAIWGVDIPGNVDGRSMRALRWMEARVFAIRGGCHDIIIRRDAVKGIRIPKELHTLEDAYIRDWIVSKDYRVLVTYASYCVHFKTLNELFSKENAASTVLELKRVKLVKERLAFAAIFAFMWLVYEIKSKANGRL